jgi:putative ABC transport system permease protein
MLQAALLLARLRSHLGRSLVLVAVVAVATGIALSALAVLRVADDPWAPLVAATSGGDVELDEAPARPDPRALAAMPEVRTVGALIESGDTALQVHGDALLAAIGTAAGVLVAIVVAPRIADSAATVFGSVTPRQSLSDVVAVGAAAVAVSVLVSGLGGLRAGRRSLAVIARGGSGRVRRSRAASLAMRASSSSTLVLGLKDIATRRGRAIVTVLSVTLAVTIAVAIVGLGTSELNPEIAPTQAAPLPADPADISNLPVFSSAVSGQAIGRIMTLITALQVLLGAVAVITLLAAASMSIQERLRELGVLHALGATTGQLAGASAVSQGALGTIGALLGVPLGLGVYLLFKAMAGGGFTGSPPPLAVVLIALGAVAVAAAAGALPALLAQRVPTSQALAAE